MTRGGTTAGRERKRESGAESIGGQDHPPCWKSAAGEWYGRRQVVWRGRLTRLTAGRSSACSGPRARARRRLPDDDRPDHRPTAAKSLRRPRRHQPPDVPARPLPAWVTLPRIPRSSSTSPSRQPDGILETRSGMNRVSARIARRASQPVRAEPTIRSGPRPTRFSGGEARRLEIARSLITEQS